MKNDKVKCKNDYNYIRREVIKIVKNACAKRKNYFGSRTWEYHILPVVSHSLKLGKILKADLEVLELAALLHDYANLVDNKKFNSQHHKYGAIFAREILENLKLPENKINQVADCIYSHRGSLKIKAKTLEARILKSADAMSHITELADMFFLTYGIHRLGSLEGAKWLKEKLRRSWHKIMPEGKKLVREDYIMAIKILNKK
ncbi:MAG: HD domain-containing protein [Candidatus Falkowbacteria bacterium]|nr:HD domain-containing protein [Candidatus Falkowbacteria bacterium]